MARRTFEQIMEQIRAEGPAAQDMAAWEDMAIDAAMAEAAGPDDDGWANEIAMQAGMGMGIGAYDDALGPGPIEFTESEEGYEARERWAERYDELDGAPEGDWDR